LLEQARRDVAARCRGITKAYGRGPARVTALRGIDLEVLRGELLMVVGPSGCGKTTLISILGAILDQDEGEREILGIDPGAMVETEKARFRGQSIGFVFQAFNLLPALSAAENVAIPLLLSGVTYRRATPWVWVRARALRRRGSAVVNSNAWPSPVR
jgi:putative ABC transport system ATP-binding protein